MCWCSTGAAGQPQLLVSMQGGGLLVLSPPAASSRSSGAVELSFAQLHAVTASTEVPLLQLAAVLHSAAAGSSSSGNTDSHGQQLLGLGSDGQLHRLLLPSDAAGWAALHGKTLSSAAKQHLPAAGVALAASPGGSQLLLSLADGSLAVQHCTALIAAVGSSSSRSGAAVQRVAAHAGSVGGAASLLAWSADGTSAASAAADGILLLHALPSELRAAACACIASMCASHLLLPPAVTACNAGAEHASKPARLAPLDAANEDREAPDDAAAATLGEAAAAAAQACSDGEPVRQATLLELRALRDELAQVRWQGRRHLQWHSTFVA